MMLLRRVILSSIILFTAVSPLVAQQMYITNEAGETLQLLDWNTRTLSVLYNIGAKPDDLTLSPSGQLIYSIPALGNVDMYDPTTGTNSVLITGAMYARDLLIEPGGQTMLVALETGKILRYNFTAGTAVTLSQKLGSCDGIAYDGFGNLYAVAHHNTIVQIDPVSGAVLSTLVLEPHHVTNGADGMVYDPFTGNLWATHSGTTGNGVIEIFTSAAGFTSAGFTYFELNPHFGFVPDGVKSDGKGNLYIGAIWTAAIYNIPTNTLTNYFVAKSADGVSLVPGTY
ncbi:MAG: hypothetical protein WBQ08_07280 [Candidatus Sulfotelmatobacter sp.]